MLKRCIPIIVIFGIFGCAQVGVLTGGGRDVSAPKIVESTPTMGALQTFPEEITLKFDEFVEVVNPSETFRLEPADAVLQTNLKQKELRVSLKGTLKPNTTYTLSIVGGIKDVTEGNDSIYQIVFATGNRLDTLKQWYRIGDAYTKKSLAGVTLALYDSLQGTRPRYLTKSDREGWAKFDYLPADSFFVKAFIDANKNQILDFQESQDQHFFSALPRNDTLAFLLSVPRNTKRSYNFKVIPPGILVGHVPEEIPTEKIKVNGAERPVYRIARDSIALQIEELAEDLLRITTPYDTLEIPYRPKDRATPLKGELIPSVIKNCLCLQWNAFLQPQPDITKFKLQKEDSSIVKIERIETRNHELLLFMSQGKKGKMRLTMEAGAVSSLKNTSSIKSTFDLVALGPEELGSLKVKYKENRKGYIAFLEKDGKTVQRHVYHQKDQYSDSFMDLIPGEYQLVLVRDTQKNGYWDPINSVMQVKAEAVERYTKLPKVRANWEIEAELE